MPNPIRLALIVLVAFGSLSVATAHAAIHLRFANVQVSHDTFRAHSEPAIAENPVNHRDLIAASKLFTDPQTYQFKIGTYYSLNGGRSWHDNGTLPGFDGYSLTSDVSLAFSKSGVAYACVLAIGDHRSGIFVLRSTDGGKTWGPPSRVFLDTSGATFSDKPWIAVDKSSTRSAGTLYVAWNLDGNADKGNDGERAVKTSPRTPELTPGIVLARSTDGGRTFSSPTLIQSFDESDAIGAIPAVTPHGDVDVAYVSFSGPSRAMDQINLARSTDHGRSFSLVTVQTVRALPAHLGASTFRSVTLPTFAVSSRDGSLIIAWADERNGDADILVTTSLDNGVTWTAPYRVNHDHLNNGKDQFQPELAVAPDGQVTCAWFDRRHDPQNRLIDEEIAQSNNDGRTFGHNFRVTRTSWDPAIDAPEPESKVTNTFIGDYQALAVDNLTVHPLWNDTQNGKSQEIRTAVLAEVALR